MAKTRKSEMEITGAAAAPAPVRRRATAAGTTGRQTAATRKRAVMPDQVAETPAAEAPAVEEPVEILAVEIEEISVIAEPTQEQIAALAYSYWVDRGYQGGSPEQDWLRAERELRNTATIA